MLALSLPLPPSANHLFSNAPGRGRIKTAAYREWLNTAGWEVKAQARGAATIAGPYRLTIEVSAPLYDIDNVVKPCSDLLQVMRLVQNDKQMAELTVTRGDGPRGVRLMLEAVGTVAQARRAAWPSAARPIPPTPPCPSSPGRDALYEPGRSLDDQDGRHPPPVVVEAAIASVFRCRACFAGGMTGVAR